MIGKLLVDYEGTHVDVGALAFEAVSLLSDGDEVKPSELAEFFRNRLIAGKMTVLKRDNPFDIDLHIVNALVSRMHHWVRSAHRFKQMNDPDLIALRPLVEIMVEKQCCEEGRALEGKLFAPKDLPRFPLQGCRLGRCDCGAKSLSKRELRKRGVAL